MYNIKDNAYVYIVCLIKFRREGQRSLFPGDLFQIYSNVIKPR